jgi:cyclic pyranopterin phosphate synthase
MNKLTHFRSDGSVRMVDVSAKSATVRRARAGGMILMSKEVLRRLPENAKGNPLEIAKIAGICAAKQTASLIPLCHSLPLSHVDVKLEIVSSGVKIEATASTLAATGVEMEALTAVSVAALTVYDMCKAIDKSMTITDISLLEKTGGKSGEYRRETAPSAVTKRSTKRTVVGKSSSGETAKRGSATRRKN